MTENALPAEGEVQRIREVLESIDFPPGVVSYRFEVGADWTGDPAVKIWLLVDEDIVHLQESIRITTDTEPKIRDALTAAGIRRWPYVLVRTEAEQRELDSQAR
jgi:hypothetical protein